MEPSSSGPSGLGDAAAASSAADWASPAAKLGDPPSLQGGARGRPHVSSGPAAHHRTTTVREPSAGHDHAIPNPAQVISSAARKDQHPIGDAFGPRRGKVRFSRASSLHPSTPSSSLSSLSLLTGQAFGPSATLHNNNRRISNSPKKCAHRPGARKGPTLPASSSDSLLEVRQSDARVHISTRQLRKATNARSSNTGNQTSKLLHKKVQRDTWPELAGIEAMAPRQSLDRHTSPQPKPNDRLAVQIQAAGGQHGIGQRKERHAASVRNMLPSELQQPILPSSSSSSFFAPTTSSFSSAAGGSTAAAAAAADVAVAANAARLAAISKLSKSRSAEMRGLEGGTSVLKALALATTYIHHNNSLPQGISSGSPYSTTEFPGQLMGFSTDGSVRPAEKILAEAKLVEAEIAAIDAKIAQYQQNQKSSGVVPYANNVTRSSPAGM